MNSYKIKLANGTILELTGICHATYEDGFYERLKRKMRSRDPGKLILESGKTYSIYETKLGVWYFVTTNEAAIGNLDGFCDIDPNPVSTYKKFSSEAELLGFMRDGFNPSDPDCHFRNLIGVWDRHDLLQEWIDENS